MSNNLTSFPAVLLLNAGCFSLYSVTNTIEFCSVLNTFKKTYLVGASRYIFSKIKYLNITNIVLFFIALFFFSHSKLKKKTTDFIMIEAKSYIKETKINHAKCR